MNYGWGVLPLGVVAGETFRDHAPRVLAVASYYAARSTGAIVWEAPPVFLLQARTPGPNTFAGIIDSPPVFLFNARLSNPLTYKIVYDRPPVIAATVSLPSPEDSEVSLLAPRAVFYGYTFDGTSLSIPIADLAGLSVEEADVVTGDWRKILQAVLTYSVEYHSNFQWSIQPRTYDVFKMDLPNSRYIDRHFLTHFYTDMGDPNVAQEP
jgi:hypothetical protein